MAKKLRLLKGGRKKEDIYDTSKKDGYIDIEGETQGIPDPFYDEDDDWRRYKAEEMIKQITTDPIEHSIAELMLENHTEREIAEILKISLVRVEWFIRKIEAWKRNIQGDKKDT